jgi:hypothetical protein
MKVVRFIRDDFMSPIRYGEGEIAGFEDAVADRLIARGYAVLHGDGKPKKVGQKIVDEPGSGYWSGAENSAQIAALKSR